MRDVGGHRQELGGRCFSNRQEFGQQELQPFEQEMEVVAGCGEHGVNGIASTVCQMIASEEITKPICKKTAAARSNSGKNHSFETSITHLVQQFGNTSQPTK